MSEERWDGEAEASARFAAKSVPGLEARVKQLTEERDNWKKRALLAEAAFENVSKELEEVSEALEQAERTLREFY